MNTNEGTQTGEQSAVAGAGAGSGGLASLGDPEWAKLALDYVINGMYQRQVLSTRERELCAIAALTILHRTPQLKIHIRNALAHCTPEEIKEVIMQMSVYGGFPTALMNLEVLREVLQEQTAHG